MIRPITGFFIYGFLVLVCLMSGLAAAEMWFDIKEVADEVNSINCQEGLSLNFSDAFITRIGGNFIVSPSVKCIDLANNHLQTIEVDAFDSLPNLMYLNLSENSLQNRSLLSFGGYKSLRILSLDYAVDVYNGYSSYPQDLVVNELYPELRYLSLRGNAISSFVYFDTTRYSYNDDKLMNAFPNIMYVDLSENRISKIDFQSSKSLKYLFLQNNQLNSARIHSTGNLLVLNVDHNEFERISDDYDGISLKGLKQLKQFSITNNIIYSIDPQAFSDTTELIFLNLTNNQLNDIDPMTFNSLKSLEYLGLDYNKLTNIPNITIKTNIRILSLYKNGIESIPDRIFINSPFLEKLDLAKNEIKDVDVSAFNGLKRLEYMDLANNKLTSLPENWCASLTSLKFLDLSSNLFTSLQSLSLMDVMPLQQLNLYNHGLKYIHAPFVRNLPENVTINLSEESGDNMQ